MRPRLHLAVLLIALLSTNHVAAQSLSDKLIAENPRELARQARSKGDIVRGAILFHQGNINCSKCHRSTSESDRIGPDLSRLDPEVTDEYLIEAILQPSKTIKKGFETTTVSTFEGELFSGIKVSEDRNKMVIRDLQNIDQLIEIPLDDIEERRVSSKSSMPDNLVETLKNRQQFLDLLRYVIDIKERQQESAVSTTQQKRRRLTATSNGIMLIQKMNCAACHDMQMITAAVAPKQAPNLALSAKRINPAYLQKFIANPQATKNQSTMPDLLGHFEEEARQQTAAAITHFLLSKNESQFKHQPIDRQSIQSGFELFHSTGCVACHSPRNKLAVEQSVENATPLGTLDEKYDIDGLVQFLKDPLLSRPSGHMPNMKLSHREATEISNYLLQETETKQAPWNLDLDLARQGETLFQDNNCAVCHTGVVEPVIGEPKLLAIEKGNVDKGCLSGQQGKWPAFHFSTEDLNDIRAVLEKSNLSLSQEEQIEISLGTFNCIACHDRGNLGGVKSDLNYHFRTTNLNLGDQGRIPPTLTGVGAKLKPAWMRDVLVNGRSVRPYMKTRMPQYGEQNVGHLVELFCDLDELEAPKFAEFVDQEAMRKKGLELAGNQGLNCVACHTYKYKDADTMPAVDLTEMTDRLNKDWFYQYMLNPQKYSPNTVMPSFWPGGVGIRKDIAGSPEDQVEALWQYLIDGRQARMPRGVVRESLEIAVTDEAKILRRSYPDIGKRGVGVGYPGGVNLAFDAEQMRLAMIWKGRFVDPGGVWTGQGSGNVRPLGKVINFAKGPDLDRADEPWIVDEGRPPKHRFRGYQLDSLQRPTFRYSFDSVDVEDFFSEANVESQSEQQKQPQPKFHLKRRVAFTASETSRNLRFRIAAAPNIRAVNESEFTIGDRLMVQLNFPANSTPAIITDNDVGQFLSWQFQLKADEKQVLEIEYFWE